MSLVEFVSVYTRKLETYITISFIFETNLFVMYKINPIKVQAIKIPNFRDDRYELNT